MAENETLVYSVKEATQLLHLSRNSVYQAISTGQIPHVKVGKRLLIPKFALEQLLNGAGKHKESQ